MPGVSRNQLYRREFNSGPDVDRTAFFSDAVFAIAMTLLAVGIQVPRVPADQLGEAVAGQFREFAAYALSFVVTAAYWLSHHRLFRSLRGFTQSLQRLNLLLLLFVALIGYATDVLAFYADEAVGVAIYAGLLGLTGTVDTLMWLYCSRRGLFRDGLPPELLRTAWIRAGIAPAVFLLSIPIAFLDEDVAKYSWLAMVVINLLVGIHDRRPLPGL
ncbi:TMEM175 family protein [Arthrobacter sp. zg-Y877]|uniref:TMEM175 family protein n=1 Tax=Arthrobacter sp. zg-Y877 TaxID=3049074 RepID=UPI0025A3F850|nr:TMEM175 family protein [Arthrobacter sp. zg-Y877]